MGLKKKYNGFSIYLITHLDDEDRIGALQVWVVLATQILRNPCRVGDFFSDGYGENTIDKLA